MIVADKKNKCQVTSESSGEVMNKSSSSDPSDSKGLNRQQVEIINWLEKVRFRKQLFGGVKEEDVWKKIQELNEMYDAALKAERVRYDALLKEQSKNTNLTLQTNNLTKESFVDE